MKNLPHEKTGTEPVPGGIYLCQVNERVSCGACCGLYNVAGVSRQLLTEVLLERTTRFDETPRETNTILEFGRVSLQKLTGEKPYHRFHHCPYAGFIGENRSRVGCLLHPLGSGNNGVDFRGLSDYGGMACRIYFCPSYPGLPPHVKAMVKLAASDWYQYGLVITETKLLTVFFEGLEKRVRKTPAPEDLADNEYFRESFQEFMGLKENWPYRPHSDPGPCNYFFSDPPCPKPDVVLADGQSQPLRHAALFRELKTEFRNENDRRDAESMIDNLLDRLADVKLGTRSE